MGREKTALLDFIEMIESLRKEYRYCGAELRSRGGADPARVDVGCFDRNRPAAGLRML
jgi:hypothetical protein